MRLSGYHLSYGLAAPIGMVLGALGALALVTLPMLASGGPLGTVGLFELYVLAIVLVVGAVAGLAHSAVAAVGGLLGATVAGTCDQPWGSRTMPAVAGAAVASALVWSTVIAVMAGSLSADGDAAWLAAMAAICTALSAIAAGLLVLIDERRARIRLA